MLPSLQIVGVYLDAWTYTGGLLQGGCSDTRRRVARRRHRRFCGKPRSQRTHLFPAPFRNPGKMWPPRLCAEMFFGGAVMGYNWYRAFWLTAAAAAKLPIETRLTTHASDGLPAMESSVCYMRETC